jgi:hypothetical protein
MPITEPGSLDTTAWELGTLADGIPVNYSGAVGSIDPVDVFRFTVSSLRQVSISLTGLPAGRDADLSIIDASGMTVYARSVLAGNSNEPIDLPFLDAGTYYIRITPFDTVAAVSGLDYAYNLAVTATLPAQARIGFQSNYSNDSEPNSGSAERVLTLVRDGDTSGASSVDWSLADPGMYAINGADATDFSGATSGTVNFTAGQSIATITLTVVGDTDIEADEWFNVVLNNASNAVIQSDPYSGQPSGVSGQINNDDGVLPLLGIETPYPQSDYAQNEGGTGTTTNFIFTVTRDSGDSTSSVEWQVRPGYGLDGASPSDFGGAFPGGTVTFDTGQFLAYITVEVAGDGQVERWDRTSASSCATPSAPSSRPAAPTPPFSRTTTIMPTPATRPPPSSSASARPS